MRVVRLLSWLGFNALISLTGTLNNTWEVYSKPSPDRSAYASCYKLCVMVSLPVTLLGSKGGHAGLVSPGSFSGYCPPAGAGTPHCRPKPGYRLRPDSDLRAVLHIRGDQHALSRAVLVPS